MLGGEEEDAVSAGSPKKAAYAIVVLLEIGAILGLLALIYNTLFPKAYWQSRELEQNYGKWESENIRDYSMSVSIECFCQFEPRMPLEVVVRDGKVLSVTDAQGVGVPSDDELRQNYPYALTIEGLFRYGYGSIWNELSASVLYDTKLGYPKDIGVELGTGTDQGIGFEVENLQVLPP